MNNIRTTNPHIDTENPLVNKIIEEMCKRGRQAKGKDPVAEKLSEIIEREEKRIGGK